MPASVDEAVALLAEFGPQDGRILAGGQSSLPTMAFAWRRRAHLIDINRIAELAELTATDKVITIGACVRHAAFEADTLPGATGALLRKVCRQHRPCPDSDARHLLRQRRQCRSCIGMVLRHGGA